jgi:Novel STAND NTPase 1
VRIRRNVNSDLVGPDNVQVEAMRAGVRASVIRRMGPGLRRLSPPKLMGVLCASALAPLIVAGPGLSGLLAAGIGVLGSIGAGVLTDVVVKVTVSSGGRARGRDEVERELADRIERALLAGDGRAAALRADIATVLRTIGAAEAAFEAALETGDESLQGDLIRAFAVLGGNMDEFAFLLADVSRAAGSIQETLRQQEVERRVDRDRDRQRTVQLQMLREELAVIERRTRRSGLDGEDSTPTWEGAPYRGLWPFEEDHYKIFYGREQVTAELLANLAERLVGLGMLVVTGADGAGKSSLRAGLMPAVARGSLAPGSQTWPRVVITPTATPLDELATHLAVLGGYDVASLRRASPTRWTTPIWSPLRPETGHQRTVHSDAGMARRGSRMEPDGRDGRRDAGALRQPAGHDPFRPERRRRRKAHTIMLSRVRIGA